MEGIKEKIPMILAFIVGIVICVAVFYWVENYNENYYAQIDNTKIEKLSTSDEMKYQYTLDCYTEKGNKKEIKFKTSRELKEASYLKLEVLVTGVHKWEEVQYNELPEEVKANYTQQ